jgi:hypothetical protein
MNFASAAVAGTEIALDDVASGVMNFASAAVAGVETAPTLAVASGATHFATEAVAVEAPVSDTNRSTRTGAPMRHCSNGGRRKTQYDTGR